MKYGIIIFAHGSSVRGANEAVFAATQRFAAAGAHELVERAFLELAEPDLATAAERLIARGARRIIVIPYFLTLGIHLQRDLPRLVEEVRARRPEVEFTITPPLDGHPALETILLDRAREALAAIEVPE